MKCRDPLRKSSCGCCDLPDPAIPEVVRNRPNLSTIGYRIGTYAAFRQAMIQAISHHPELRGNTWTTRTSDDYGIALIEMWAYLADILTFYQERLANEAYLRTAILPESVTRLVGLLDYKLFPGAAAFTYLAFALEKDKRVKIPAGLRVQSVPTKSEKPQKFETEEGMESRAEINKIRIYPSPHNYNPFFPGRNQGHLDPGFAEAALKILSPGDKFVVFFDDASHASHIEEKLIDSIQVDGELTTLFWKPRIRSNIRNIKNPHAFKFVKKYRLFGYNAPREYMASSYDNGNFVWEVIKENNKKYPFNIQSGCSELNLDGLYDDLKNGMQILISIKKDPKTDGSISQTVLSKVNGVSQVSVSLGPLSATVSRIAISGVLPHIYNLRTVEVYLLESPEIRLLNYHYPKTIKGNTIYIPLIMAEGLTPKRTLILDDKNAKPQVVKVNAISDFAYQPHLKAISFDPELDRTLDGKSAFLYGNVVQATQGETVRDEVLGDGDASVGLQSFTIGNPRVTYTQQPDAPRGVANTLQVRVDGILWHEVSNLYGRLGDERIYTTEVDNDGKMTARFGDGINGARLASGSGNVTATYRRGLGGEGNIEAGSLKILLDRPIGLKSVINPIDARGGEDPENLEDARKNAPNNVRTFGRIVSLRDFEDAAREFRGTIAKAKSSWYWDGEDQSVLLTVAAKGDSVVNNSDPIIGELISYLNARRDPNRKLLVKVRKKVNVMIEAEIKVDSDYLVEEVQKSARKALSDDLSFESLDLGQAIHLSDLYLTLQSVKGVKAARIVRLCFKDLSFDEQIKRRAAVRSENGQIVLDPVQKHLFFNSDELAAIEDSNVDMIVDLWRSNRSDL